MIPGEASLCNPTRGFFIYCYTQRVTLNPPNCTIGCTKYQGKEREEVCEKEENLRNQVSHKKKKILSR